MSAPRVLVSGVVLGQPMGGVRRHNQELLPRLARLLEEDGGGLAILEGRKPVALELPPSIERFPSSVPSSPPLVRAMGESRVTTVAEPLYRRTVTVPSTLRFTWSMNALRSCMRGSYHRPS